MVLSGAGQGGQGVEMDKLARDGIEEYERDGFVVVPGQVDSWEEWRNKRAAAIAAAQSRTSTEV